MNRTVLKPGQPIRNLQHFLRLISYYYNTVPAVIPDGIFSPQTKESVMGFQKTFGLPVTGVVDFDTWNQIIKIFNEISEYEEEALRPLVFPATDFTINPGESPLALYIIHSMLYSLSSIFKNLGNFNITGTHDESSVNLIKLLQKLFNLEPNGIIDKKTFNMISALYNNHAESTFLT